MNPFTPTFGVSPPVLADRAEPIAAFREALADGVGAPGRAMLITGARGVGKTVLLNEIEDTARRADWLVISDTTRVGMAADLATTQIARLLHEHDKDARVFVPSVGSASAIGLSASAQGTYENRVPQPEWTFRAALERLTEVAAAELGSGVLLTLDEVHRSCLEDLREIVQTVQHCFREGRQVAVVLAGLPGAVTDLVNDNVISFLRRADRHVLGMISETAATQALHEPIQLAGRTIGPEALAAAVEGARGYPFMVQLVGYHAWRADTESPEITVAHVEAGVVAAQQRSGTMIHEPSLHNLSEIDRTFLAAMAVDDTASRTADVATRMEVDLNYANQYRRRLLAAEVIVASRHGTVDFQLPYLREYLRDAGS